MRVNKIMRARTRLPKRQLCRKGEAFHTRRQYLTLYIEFRVACFLASQPEIPRGENFRNHNFHPKARWAKDHLLYLQDTWQTDDLLYCKGKRPQYVYLL